MPPSSTDERGVPPLTGPVDRQNPAVGGGAVGPGGGRAEVRGAADRRRVACGRVGRWLPDALSAARGVLALALPLTVDRPALLVTLYVTAGLTDALDGPLARRLGTAGPRGARIDSAADVLLFAAATWLVARLLGDAAVPLLAAAAGVAVIKVAAVAVGVRRFRRVVPRHTAANRVAGLAVFTAPLLALAGWTGALWCVAAVAGAAAVDELVVQSRAATPDPDRRT